MEERRIRPCRIREDFLAAALVFTSVHIRNSGVLSVQHIES